jgi:nucleoid-associated protein YgaU
MVAGGGSANAATQEQWESIAQCESGNDWSINWSSDGLSVGGLQFQNASWKTALAYLERQGIDTSNWTQELYQGMPRDEVPTKYQTILAGEALLAIQGSGAWVCKGIGLSTSMFEGGQRPAILAEGQTSDSPASTPPPQKAAPQPDPTRNGGTYTVRPGDTLYSITKAQTGSNALDNWQELYEANKDVVGGNPHLIHPDQVLEVPWEGS